MASVLADGIVTVFTTTPGAGFSSRSRILLIRGSNPRNVLAINVESCWPIY